MDGCFVHVAVTDPFVVTFCRSCISVCLYSLRCVLSGFTSSLVSHPLWSFVLSGLKSSGLTSCLVSHPLWSHSLSGLNILSHLTSSLVSHPLWSHVLSGWSHGVSSCGTTERYDVCLIACNCTACRFDKANVTADVQRHYRSHVHWVHNFLV